MTPACPRCPDAVLLTSSTHGVWVMYCPKCWGLWVDHASVRHVAGVAVDGATSTHGDGLACPICRAGLRAWSAKGLVIDRCDAHGVWFDRAELDHLVAHGRAGHGGTTTDAAVVGGVALVAGAASVAGVAAGQGNPQPSRLDAVGTTLDVVEAAVPVVDAGDEIVAGAGEVVSGAGDLADAGIEAASGVAEAGAEAAGGVFEAVGAIFELFS